MLGKQLRKKFTREFIQFSKNSNLFSGVLLFIHILQLIGLISLGYYTIGLNLDYSTAYFAIIMFLIATRLRAFNNIIHECSHYSFCKSKSLNILFGKISALIIFSSYYEYKNEHMTHHKSLGNFEKDLDFQNRQKFKFEEALSTKVVIKHIITPIAGLHFPQYFAFDMGFKDGRVFGFMKAIYLITIIGFVFVNLNATMTFIVLPFAWIYPAINYWTDCVDHAGRLEVGDDLYKSRNFIIHKSIRWILFPRNDCYHLIHHLFPSVPSHQLEAAHDELMTDWSYAEAMQYLGNVPKHRLMVVL